MGMRMQVCRRREIKEEADFRVPITLVFLQSGNFTWALTVQILCRFTRLNFVQVFYKPQMWIDFGKNTRNLCLLKKLGVFLQNLSFA